MDSLVTYTHTKHRNQTNSFTIFRFFFFSIFLIEKWFGFYSQFPPIFFIFFWFSCFRKRTSWQRARESENVERPSVVVIVLCIVQPLRMPMWRRAFMTIFFITCHWQSHVWQHKSNGMMAMANSTYQLSLRRNRHFNWRLRMECLLLRRNCPETLDLYFSEYSRFYADRIKESLCMKSPLDAGYITVILLYCEWIIKYDFCRRTVNWHLRFIDGT